MSHAGSASPARPNRLIHETSPYLLQHAHNPVDWYPWGEEALRRAKAENRPILLSIGYSSCHWCHVMERESFQDEATAALMNRHFVCIKVDREERPDLDAIYLAATVAMNQGQGGWPMTVFLTPDQRPFFAGTYFPPRDGLDRPGFPSLLTQLAALWERQGPALAAQAEEVTAYLRELARPAPGGGVGEAEIRAAVQQLAATFDKSYGGFGPPPKFPPHTALPLLLRHHRRTGDPELLAMVTKTLDAMAQGGIYDQIGGGFARYATDARWLVPHFEKMLDDNALLAKLYLEGYQATGSPGYARIAREICDYVLREMTGPEGGFFSATDADSEGEEGKFFVWTPQEIDALLGPEAGGWFAAYYDISEEGNWEGKSIPNTPRSVERVAGRLGIPAETLRQSLARSRQAVYQARLHRVPPGLDDKLVTAWNGMMLGALAEAARVLDEPRYLAASARAADFLLAALRRPDGRLLRTYRAGRAHLDAYLADYAFLAEGLLDLYEAGGAPRYLAEALRLAERILADFADPEGGGFYETAAGHEPLLLRHRSGEDGATASPNAVAALTLARLAVHLDRPDLRQAAVGAIQAYGRAIAGRPRAFCKSLAVADFLMEDPLELALLGAPGETAYRALAREIGRRYLPNRILAHHDPAAEPAPALPLLAGKGPVEGGAALYVCRHFACQAPVTDPAGVEAALAGRPAEAARTGIATRRPGRATAEATAAAAQRLRAAGLSHGFAPLGKTGLVVSRLGFGGYRVDDETPEHRAALVEALEAGCTLIDTSTNYTDGGSERLVGSVLAELAASGRLPRQAVVVVSKLGYVQGQNLELALEREAAGRPFPEMVKYQDDCWHCLHPEFLRDQLGRSLDRLRLECLDVCLLHNPEYFLSDAKRRRRGEPEALRAEFYRRLGAAFAFLEGETAAGRIGCYGVSSNTAVSAADDPEATSLSRMLEAARQAGGADHHFRVLELPLNLCEAGAVFTANTGRDGRETPLGLAAREGLAVLVNRPLNAYAGSRMIRLADVALEGEAVGPAVAEALRPVAALEAEFRASLAPALQAPEGAPPPDQWFRWAEQLETLPAHLQGLEQWQQLEEQMIAPAVAGAVGALEQGLEGPLAAVWRAWRDRYLPALDSLLDALRLRAARHSQGIADRLSAALNPHLPPARREERLSRKALWTLASTPGVTAVLVGMRHPDYVADGMEILRWPPLPDAVRLYRAVAELRIG